MFGRTSKRPKAPDSRFCLRPTEVPYAQLYSYDHFIVALSKISTTRAWPVGSYSSDGPVAYGLLHGSHTFPDHGVEEPLLPVQVSFGEDRFHPEQFGSAHFDRSLTHGIYVLNVRINDPEGSIAAAFETAMERAIVSGFDFMHLRCVKDRDPAKPHRTDYSAQIKEDRSFLLQVEAGEAEFGRILFDRVFFDDGLTTKAPSWSWGWNGWEFDLPRFKSRATAKWRRNWLPHRLK
jgi:hypothetical protein